MGKIIPFSNLRVLSYRTRNLHKARTCKQLSETHDFDARMDVNFGRLQYPPVVIHFMILQCILYMRTGNHYLVTENIFIGLVKENIFIDLEHLPPAF